MNTYKMGCYLAELIFSALEGSCPGELPSDLDWETVFRFSQYHKVQNLVFPAVNRLKNKPEDRLLALWKAECDRAVIRCVSFAAERQKIFAAFEKRKIPYALLKGAVLQDYYPKSSMRLMADNDILYQGKDAEALSEIMAALDYKEKTVKASEIVHDVFVKKPFYNFEFHRKLFLDGKQFSGYFSDIWDRLMRIDPEKQAFRMTNEDFYLYFITHFYKHYSCCGTGLRSLTDLYVFLKKFNDSLDWEEIDKGLVAVGLKEFEEQMRILTLCLFRQEPLTEEQKEIFLYLLDSGMYGTIINGVKAKVKEHEKAEGSKSRGKLKYIWGRLFPPRDFLTRRFPVLEKHPALFPIFYVYRFFLIKKKAVKELETVYKS